jgi:hypothetical protein
MQPLQSHPRTKATTFKRKKAESLQDMFVFQYAEWSYAITFPGCTRPLAASAKTAPTRSLLRRSYDAIVAQQHTRAEWEVACFLRTYRDRFTDALEREIERKFPGY